MQTAVSPITGAAVKVGFLSDGDMFVRNYAHEADGFDDLLLGTRIADDLKFGNAYADGDESLDVAEVRAALALVRSYLWRSRKGVGKPPIVAAEAELASLSAVLEQSGDSKRYVVRTIGALASEARALSFEDKCGETVVNLRLEVDGGKHLLTNPYAVGVNRDIVFKPRDHAVMESGITYGCTEADAPYVYDQLKREGMLEVPPTGGAPQGFVLTGKGFALTDKMGRTAGGNTERTGVGSASTIQSTGNIYEAQEGSLKGVFVGHGRNKAWHEVSTYLVNTFGIHPQTFERHSGAGQQVIPTLQTLLDESGFAIIVATAEDETKGEGFQARQNVVHETGLFQGRLGFDRVAILMQRGIRTYTNLDGLIVIPFDEGHVEQTFEALGRALRKANYKEL